MQHVKRTANAAVETPEDERSRAVLKLYTKTFSTILGTLSEDRDLMAWQASDIITGLAAHLGSYPGSLDDEYEFLLWALGIVAPASKLIILLTKYGNLIRHRIRVELHSNVLDCAVDTEDVFQEIAILIWNNLDSLTTRGAARLPRRLSALIHRHCGFIHKKRRNRMRIVAEAGDSIGMRGVAILSAEERASQRFDESGGDGDYSRTETVSAKSWGYHSA